MKYTDRDRASQQIVLNRENKKIDSKNSAEIKYKARGYNGIIDGNPSIWKAKGLSHNKFLDWVIYCA